MKAHHFLLPVLIFIALAAIGTKPGNQQCISEVQAHDTTTPPDMISILYQDSIQTLAVEIEDRIFYKVAYDKANGNELAIFVFGKPIWQ